MESKYTKRHLKTDCLDTLKAECELVGLLDDEGEIIKTSHNHHLNVIETKYSPTGVTLTDEGGNEYPEMEALDGCYAELSYKIDVGLNHLAYSCPECIDSLRAELADKIAVKRWEVCNAGVLINGFAIQSDTKSKDEMGGYVTESIINGLVNVYWKMPDDTFKVFSVQEFKKVYQTVAKYRNDCFGVEHFKSEQLLALDNPIALDIESGWPDNNFTIPEIVS